MKALVLGMILVAGLSSQASNSQLVVLEGHIKRVTTAEFDPFVVGDACLIEIEDEKNDLYAVLTDYDSCTDNTDELFEGRALVVVTTLQDEMTSGKAFEIIKESTAAKRLFNVDFGAIENGLADLK